MIDGPGPPATCLVTVWFAPFRVAWIRSGVNAPWFTRETQRIFEDEQFLAAGCAGFRA